MLETLDQAPEIVVEGIDVARLHPQGRVRILADLSKRDPAPGLRLRVELLVPDLTGLVRHRRDFRSEALRVDVHDGGQTGTAHRGRGGRQELRRPRRQPTRLVRLRYELRPVPSAEPEERRRAEQFAGGSIETGTKLVEQSQSRGLRGGGHQDPDEM